LWQHRRATFDTRLTDRDRRRISAIVIYLIVPVAVALATGLEAATAYGVGAPPQGVEFLFFWSHLSLSEGVELSTGARLALATTGPATLILIASLLILWSVKRPARAAVGYLRLECARVLLWLVLVVYPIGSLLLRSGQFWEIQSLFNESQPFLGDIILAAYGIAGFRVGILWRGPWGKRYAWLASPLRDRLTKAETRLRVAPNSVEALRELGRVYLSVGDSESALGPLRSALRLFPRAPETNFLTGIAHLRDGRPRRASEHLRRAGKHLSEQREEEEMNESRSNLYFEVTLGLAAARLALDDAEGAILTAEAAGDQRPRDPRAALVHADALLVSGRRREARTLLERALPHSHGHYQGEILRRLTLLNS
jgi:tetratricopeptide (TPR) repeat protein